MESVPGEQVRGEQENRCEAKVLQLVCAPRPGPESKGRSSGCTPLHTCSQGCTCAATQSKCLSQSPRS
eukprot:3181849-Rhodomonas_salina.2